MTAFRWIGKVTAGAASATLMALLGLPALGALVFLVVLAVGTAGWVLLSDARADRASRVLLAWRGNPGNPPADNPTAPILPAPTSRRWPRPRP